MEDAIVYRPEVVAMMALQDRPGSITKGKMYRVEREGGWEFSRILPFIGDDGAPWAGTVYEESGAMVALMREECTLEAETEAEATDSEDFPETLRDKVGYASYVLASDLEHVGKAIVRLGRLESMLAAIERGGPGELPQIILQNELRMALEHIGRIQGCINEIAEIVQSIYRETKKEKEDK